MLNYWKILFKTTTRNKLNYLPVIVLILMALFLLIMNTRYRDNTGYIGSIQAENQMYSEIIEEYSEDLLTEMSELSFKQITEAKEELEELREKNKEAITFYRKKKWRKALDYRLNSVNRNVNKLSEDSRISYPLDYQKAIIGTQARYQYLAKRNLEPDSPGTETQGFTFTFAIMDLFFPILVLVCLIPILANLCGDNFRGGIDIENIFPMNKFKMISSKLLFGSIFASLFYFTLLVIAFICATIMNGSNVMDYPININTSSFTEIKPIIDLLPPVIILQLLCLVFSVLFVYIVANLTKNKVATMFLSILFLCGSVFSVTKLEPLQKILHLLPVTYFNTVGVIVKDIAVALENPGVNFNNGLAALIFGIVVEIGVIGLMVIPKRKLRGMITNSKDVFST